jgi:hypothetical protein
MANVDLNILFKEGRPLWFYQNVIKMLQVLSDDQFAVFGGRIQDFKLGGAHLKKNCAEQREARTFLGYFVW